MKMKNMRQSLMRQQVVEFCQQSTIHGVCYLSPRRPALGRVAWLLVLCASAVLCSFLGHMIWSQFDVDPTVTLVESTHYSTNKVPFPAVLVCDSDQVHAPSTHLLNDILLRRGYNQSSIYEFFDSISDPEEVLHFDPLITQIHRNLDDLGYPYVVVLDMVGKPCATLLARCTWRSQRFNCSEMFHRVLTHLGFCCQFDIRYFRKYASKETNFESSPERTKSLEIVINSTRLFPNGTSIHGQAELMVLDAENTPTWMDSTVLLAADSTYDVTVDVIVAVASDNVKTLVQATRRCVLPTDAGAGAGFYSGCVSDVLMRQVVELCKCLPYYYFSKEVEEYPNCTWDRYRCILQSVSDFRGSVSELRAYKACYQKCDYVQYDAQVEYMRRTRAPTSAASETRFNGEVLPGTAQVAVRLGDRTCMKYRREILFTWDQLLANLGGIFGLCMGGSIISVIELAWFMGGLTLAALRARIPRLPAPAPRIKHRAAPHAELHASRPEIAVKFPFTL